MSLYLLLFCLAASDPVMKHNFSRDMKKQHQLLFYCTNRPVKSNSKHVFVLNTMHGNEKKECIIHAILLYFKWSGCILITSSSHARLMEIFGNSRVPTVMLCLYYCEQMETDSDSIGQQPIIDGPASAVLQDSSANSHWRRISPPFI